jgi:hypothetical protein
MANYADRRAPSKDHQRLGELAPAAQCASRIPKD